MYIEYEWPLYILAPPPSPYQTRRTYRVHKVRLLLVGHGDDGEHEVDEVEGAKEDDNGEEDHVDRTSRRNNLNKK